MASDDQTTDGGPSGRSAATVAGDVLRHGSNLIQQEVELAKAEVSQKVSQFKAAIGELLAGTVLVMVSLGILLQAVVSGVARILMALFSDANVVADTDGLDASQDQIAQLVSQNIEAARALPTYEGFAALLVGLVFAVVGGVLLKNGFSKLDPENLAPSRTIRQASKDGEAVRDHV